MMLVRTGSGLAERLLRISVLAAGFAAMGCPSSSEAQRPPVSAPQSAPAPDEPVAQPQPAPPPEAGRVTLSKAFLVGGEMDRAVLDETTDKLVRAIEQATPAFRQCYAPALARNATLAGDVDVEVVIKAGGGIAKLQPMQATLADEEMVACVVKVFERMELPAPPAHFRMIAPLQFAPE